MGLDREFRKHPLQVGKHYQHDGKRRPNMHMTCLYLGAEVVVVKHLKCGLYQVRIIKGRFPWFDPDFIYKLPKSEFQPIPEEE